MASCMPSPRSRAASTRASTPRRSSCAPSKGGNYLGVTITDHRHQPRAARRAVPHAVDASDGQGRALSDGDVRPADDRQALGRVAYEPTLEAMRAFTAARDARHARRALALRAPAGLHPGPGRQGRARARRRRRSRWCAPTAAARSPTTAPGQVVAYPLVDLRRLGIYVKEYVFRLEQAVIKTLESYGVTGHRVRGAPGIYVRLDDPFGARGAAPPASPAPTRSPASARSPRSASRSAGTAPTTASRSTSRWTCEPFARIDPCGYAGLKTVDLSTIGVRATWDEAARCWATSSAPSWRLTTMSTSDVVRDAQPPRPTTPTPSRRPQAKTVAHPDQDRAGRDAEEARLDPRQGRLADDALLRDQADPARAQAAHGVRGSVLPEHRRVLRQGHRDLHDHGRHVHAPLPVLRRRPRPARSARRRRAGQPRARPSPR